MLNVYYSVRLDRKVCILGSVFAVLFTGVVSATSFLRNQVIQRRLAWSLHKDDLLIEKGIDFFMISEDQIHILLLPNLIDWSICTCLSTHMHMHLFLCLFM